MTRIGYWATHGDQFYKRSCENDLTHFCGWRILERAIQSTTEVAGYLLLILFKTGGRANEVLGLTRDNFEISEHCIDVYGMVVLKKYELILLNYPWEPLDYSSAYVTRPIRMTRNFPIKRAEPLTDLLVDFLKEKEEGEKLFKFKYNNAYRLISNIERPRGEKKGPWWPHRLRGERASQLVEEYNYTTYKLKQFFEWSSDRTPLSYVKLSTRTQKQAMGIPVPEEEKKIKKKKTPKKSKIKGRLSDEEFEKLKKEMLG